MLASRVLDWDDGHWTTFPCGSQRAQVSMLRLGGWITQLSHPRSDRQNKGLPGFVYVSLHGGTQTPQHTCHENLRGQRATLQACAVSTLWCHSEVSDHQNWKDKVKGERVLDAWLGLVEKMWNLRVGIACRVLGIVIEGSHPMLSDKIQPTGRQLWLTLQVEFTEEALPDGLQRLTLAPEHHTAFQLFKCCLK